MPPLTNLVLVGLMGAGKSTVGRLVAHETSRDLIDVDDVIASRTGLTVRQLWEEGGEVAYRELESAVVLEALRSDTPTVIAAPGGVILDARVRTALEDAFVVWLRVDPEILAGRVSPGDHRPLLGNQPRHVLTAMAEERSALYEEVADIVLDAGSMSAEDAAGSVIGWSRARMDAGPDRALPAAGDRSAERGHRRPG